MTRTLIFLLLLFFARLASAGSYQIVSLTGGEGLLNGNPLSYGNNGNSRGWAVGNIKTASDCFFTGAITATFQWVPTDPDDPNDVAPTEVIIQESTTAYLDAFSARGSVSWSVDDGVDNSQQGSGNVNLVMNGSVIKENPGGQTITLTLTPEVICTISGIGSIQGAGVSYTVDLIYPTLSIAGPTTDPITDVGLAEPVGQGNQATVSTRSVFNSINGVVTTVNWNVNNADACAGFQVEPETQTTAGSGTLVPYQPGNATTSHWYYYLGPAVDGSSVQMPLDLNANISALGISTDSELKEQIGVYGPLVNESVFPDTSSVSATLIAGGSYVEESSGLLPSWYGIWIQDPNFPLGQACYYNLPNPSPGFQFSYDEVQLRTAPNSEGPYGLDDRAYPYDVKPYDDTPLNDHNVLWPGTWTMNESFDWSAVCAPSNSSDWIYVTCGLMTWNWQQSNSYPWSNPQGEVSHSNISWGIVTPLEWDFDEDNS